MNSSAPSFPAADPSASRTLSHPVDFLLRVRGTVQGVGYRPFVHRLATSRRLRGWVRNDGRGVTIRASGPLSEVEAFVAGLRDLAPPASRVTDIECEPPPRDAPPVGNSFIICDSTAPGVEVAVTIPPDLALCPDCRAELFATDDRRYHYPFINCTNCGPRYSIIEQLPYDRARTTMRAFVLCPRCRREYGDPADRRYHAEPNACPVCGPQLAATVPSGQVLARQEAALALAAARLREGGIVAVKGIGGYHLLCDATNEAAVATLRDRKHRDTKPFAVMFPNLAALAPFAAVPPAAAALLGSPAAPIVLLPRRPGSPLAPGVTPGNPWLGAMLAYAPLHVLLLARLDFPVVATSANPADEPLCHDNTEAHARLGGIADLFLEHDRPIARPVDDSVVRLDRSDRRIMLRRARGYAPLPLTLPAALPAPLLCVGAQMKNTVAVAAGRQLVLSPHLGDLDSAPTWEHFQRTIGMLRQLVAADLQTVVHDKHPAYASTRHAAATGLPRVAVQHHLAHLLACLLDNNAPMDDVLGVVWDGTGYGEDGTVWGGEFIHLRNGRAERVGRLRPFPLPGGEAAVRDARRIALALAGDETAAPAFCRPHEAALWRQMMRQSINSPLCSSVGRLFDGFAVLLGLGTHNEFEGSLPLRLEAAAANSAPHGPALPFPLTPARTPGARFEIDWQPAVAEVLAHRIEPVDAAIAFHRGLARAIAAAARECGVRRVALTGGCFQNALLAAEAHDELVAAGHEVLLHRELSPNDNSIAAGQACAALLGLTDVTLPG